MSVTIRECPHCYMRVGFLADGVCPACGRKLSDVGADPTRTILPVSPISRLAPFSICCGVETTRRVAVSKATRSRASALLAAIRTVFAFCLAPILRGGFIGIVYAGERKKYPHQRMRVSLPLCSNCQRNYGIPKPHRVDFEKSTISFLVSREVAARLSSNTQPIAVPDAASPHR